MKHIRTYVTLRKLREVSKYGVFSGPYSVRMREDADQKKLRIWTLFTLRSVDYLGLNVWTCQTICPRFLPLAIETRYSFTELEVGICMLETWGS